MPLLLALVLLAQDADWVQNLRDVNPTVRRATCGIIAEKAIKGATLPLIDLLARETDDSVKAAAVETLERLTGVKGRGADPVKWKEWWDQTGSKLEPASTISEEKVMAAVEVARQKMEKETSKATTEVRLVSITVAIIATSFVLVMLYFVGHVSSKLKEWKELVRQAGAYIEESNQITRRTDRILEELEAKKTDILEFIKKIKDEKEAEIERYNDLLHQNTEHKMREEVMELRQKAEKELEETLGGLKAQIEQDARRLGLDQKEKQDKDFTAQHERFMREVEAHTLFLQGNFLHSRGRPEEALKIYKKLLVVKPDHQVAWERMGNAYRELMRYDEAIEAYQKAIELDPDDPSSYYNLAATWARQRKKEKMLESLTLAIKLAPEFKDEALNDPAFRDYWNDPAFKDLAEG
jgi:tetratricopeptide (TPR) repeat protein